MDGILQQQDIDDLFHPTTTSAEGSPEQRDHEACPKTLCDHQIQVPETMPMMEDQQVERQPAPSSTALRKVRCAGVF